MSVTFFGNMICSYNVKIVTSRPSLPYDDIWKIGCSLLSIILFVIFLLIYGKDQYNVNSLRHLKVILTDCKMQTDLIVFLSFSVLPNLTESTACIYFSII